jgi:diguanylate cyclase (GGDEF)-like protein
VLTAVSGAVRGQRTPAELFDAALSAIWDAVGREACGVALFVAGEARLWLEAQVGYNAVVHTIGLDIGVYGRAVRDGVVQAVADPTADPDYRPVMDGVSGLIAVPFQLGPRQALLGLELFGPPLDPALVTSLSEAAALIADAHAELSPRARTPSPTTRLSRALVRIAAQDDPARVAELALRSVGEVLGLESLEAFTGAPDELVRLAVWQQSHRAPPGPAPDAVRAAATRLGWETGYVTDGPLPLVVIPLRAGSELLGVMAGHGPVTDRLDEAELIAAHTATAIGNLLRYQSMVDLSLTDALTGLPNHRRFHEDGAALIEATAGEPDAAFALVVADLDNFKDLNDRRGHVAGDEALRLVGQMLAAGVRPDDRAYRLGGEEFALLLPATTKRNARTVCRRLQRAMAAIDLQGWRLTQSMGVASYPADGGSVRDLLVAADAALYEAKRTGKDRITLASDRLVARRTQGDLMSARGRRSFEQMGHLRSLASRLAGARSTQAVAETVLDELAIAVPYDAAVVSVGETPLRVWRGEVPDAGRGVLEATAERTTRSRRPLLVDDLDAGGLSGALATPLMAGDRAVGAIVIASVVPSSYDRDDQRLLEVIAHVTGLACENLRLLERVMTRGA